MTDVTEDPTTEEDDLFEVPDAVVEESEGDEEEEVVATEEPVVPETPEPSLMGNPEATPAVPPEPTEPAATDDVEKLKSIMDKAASVMTPEMLEAVRESVRTGQPVNYTSQTTPPAPAQTPRTPSATPPVITPEWVRDNPAEAMQYFDQQNTQRIQTATQEYESKLNDMRSELQRMPQSIQEQMAAQKSQQETLYAREYAASNVRDVIPKVDGFLKTLPKDDMKEVWETAQAEYKRKTYFDPPVWDNVVKNTFRPRGTPGADFQDELHLAAVKRLATEQGVELGDLIGKAFAKRKTKAKSAKPSNASTPNINASGNVPGSNKGKEPWED